MIYNSNHGFSTTLIIAIVVLIGLLGFVGWRVWEVSQTKQKAPEPTHPQISSGPQSNEDTTENDYLEIKELGIKIKLSSEIKDVIYTPKLDNEQYPKISLSTQALSDKSQSCSSNGIAPPLGSIMVTKQSVNELGAQLVANNDTVLKLNNTFVVWQGPQSLCSTDSAIEEIAAKQRTAFMRSFKTVQLDQ